MLLLARGKTVTAILEDVRVRVGAKYQIVGHLGRGASGSVYKAIQHPVERVVAVKMLDDAQMRSEKHRSRFRREACALGRIDHPGVVTLYDFGEHDGHYHLVTEYVVGHSLRAAIRAEAPMAPGRVLRLGIELLDALEAVHEAGFIHRDVKPANVMLYADAQGEEHVKLLDFGVAAAVDRPQHLREMVGTPRYMAREQITAGGCSPRSDLFAVGALLYEMLTGQVAFPERSVRTLIGDEVDAPVAPFDPSLEIDGALEALVLSALRRCPDQRPARARAMRDALARILDALDPSLASARAAFAGTARPRAVEAVDPTIDGVSPWARTMTHLGEPRRPTPSGPWPALDFVSGEVAAWSPHTRGSGELPRIVRSSTRSRHLARTAPPSTAPTPTASAAPRGRTSKTGVTTARLTTPACTEAPCWQRRCFWAVLGLNAIGLSLLALL